MFNRQQTIIIAVLSSLLLVLWLGIIVLVSPTIYTALVLPVAVHAKSGIEGTPVPVGNGVQPRPASIFPATWTPTPTATDIPPATKVPTYPPWATWTPTATFTPKPPTPTPLDHVKKKREAMARYRKLFREIAPKYDLDWRLMAEQGYRESGLRANARGKDGEYGMMQIMPYTWRQFSRGLKVDHPFDPRSNILVAAVYLDYVRGECKDVGSSDPGCMLLAYNWGPNNMRRLYQRNLTWEQAPYKQQRYVSDILTTAGYRK